MLKTFYILFFLVCFGVVNVDAQIIQLGTGTTITTVTTASPVNIWYRRFVSQFVYTAAEINAAGGSSTNPLTQLGFYVTQSPIYSIPGYTIKIKHTTANNVTNALVTGGWTTVVNSFTYVPVAGGYDMLEFDTPFSWDGTSNIAVEICCSQVTPNYDQSGTVRYYNTNNGYRYSWTDAVGTSCGETPGTRTNFKPQCQMIFSDQTNWLGNLSDDWFNALNWSDGVPNEYLGANITNGRPNYPLLTADGVCKDLLISNAASLEIDGSNHLDIYGDWQNLGLFNPNFSTVEFKGEVMANIDGSSTQTFFNLINRNSQGIEFNSGTYNLQGALYPEGGDIVTNDRLTIVSNSNGTGRVAEVKSFCSYTLDMFDSYGDGWNGGYLSVSSSGNVIGTYSASGTGSSATFSVLSGSTLELNYTSGTWEGENTFNLVDEGGMTIFSAGPNITTGDIYSGISSCSIVDPFVGDVTIQRYLNLGVDGWRELTSPMPNKTLNDWQNDGLVMANFPGSNWPTFGWTSVYTYDENNANGIKENGWVAATNITNPLSHLKGHRVYIGTGIFTTELKGDINVGDYSFNLDYENLSATEIAADENQKGWNLIGNPYPGTISWDSIPISDKVNVDDVLWIWSGDAGNYGAYVGGAGSGTNGVSSEIASSQAFWVHANTTSATLSMSESCKVDTDKAFVKSSNESSFIAFKLHSNFNTYSDEVLITYRSGFTNEIDQYDGLKLLSPLAQAPNLYGIVGTEQVGICSSSKIENLILPLVADVDNSGNYVLEVSQFKNVNEKCIVLEDIQTGQFHIVDSTFSMVFPIQSNQDSARFVLRSYDEVSVDLVNESCYMAEDAYVEIIGGGDIQNDFIFTNLNTGTSQNVTLNSLPYSVPLETGLYNLNHLSSAQCPDFNYSFELLPSAEIIVDTIITHSTCPSCNDGKIEFMISGGIPPYQIEVNNLDFDSASSYVPGQYFYQVSDSAGCLVVDSFEIMSNNSSLNVSEIENIITVYPNPTRDFIQIKNGENDFKIGYIYDVQGKVVRTFESQHLSINVLDLSAGLYWISIPEISPFPAIFEKIE